MKVYIDKINNQQSKITQLTEELQQQAMQLKHSSEDITILEEMKYIIKKLIF